MQNCPKRNQRKPNETDQFQFHKENEMYTQTALKPNSLLRNGAYGIVMRGVQKCTRGCSSLRGRNRLPLCCIKLDTATDPAAGSGNFFTEAYLSFRRLENKAISTMRGVTYNRCCSNPNPGICQLWNTSGVHVAEAECQYRRGKCTED